MATDVIRDAQHVVEASSKSDHLFGKAFIKHDAREEQAELENVAYRLACIVPCRFELRQVARAGQVFAKLDVEVAVVDGQSKSKDYLLRIYRHFGGEDSLICAGRVPKYFISEVFCKLDF